MSKLRSSAAAWPGVEIIKAKEEAAQVEEQEKATQALMCEKINALILDQIGFSQEHVKVIMSSYNYNSIIKLLVSYYPCGFILSADARPVAPHLIYKIEEKLGIKIYFKDEWHELFKWLNINILLEDKFLQECENNGDLRNAYVIIKSLCIYFKNHYNFMTEYNKLASVKHIIDKYNVYKNTKQILPKFICLDATIDIKRQTGKQLPLCDNIVQYMYKNFRKIPDIKAKALLRYFPDEKVMGISTFALIETLNSLSPQDRYDISINAKQWLLLNPDKIITSKKWSISNEDSLCSCSSCNKMFTPINFHKYLTGKHKTVIAIENTNGQLDSNDTRLKLLPRDSIPVSHSRNTSKLMIQSKMNNIKKYLYIICNTCSNKISSSSLITKFTQIWPGSIKTINDIMCKLYDDTVKLQFPKIDCIICTNTNYINDMYSSSMCNHPSCICNYCKNELMINGAPEKGKLIENMNYQCPCCFKFYDTLNNDLNAFLSNGGVPSGFSARFCNICMIPFQEKIACNVEDNDMSMACPSCESQRFVECPSCGVSHERIENGCDLIECKAKACACILSTYLMVVVIVQLMVVEYSFVMVVNLYWNME